MIPAIWLKNKTGSSLKIEYVIIKIAPRILIAQNPNGRWDFFEISDDIHWYIYLKVNVICEIIPRYNSHCGMSGL